MIFGPALDPTGRKQLANSPHFPNVFPFCLKTQLLPWIYRFPFNWSVATNLPVIWNTFSPSFRQLGAKKPEKVKIQFRRLISFWKCASLAMMHDAVFFSWMRRQRFWLAQIFQRGCALFAFLNFVQFCRNSKDDPKSNLLLIIFVAKLVPLLAVKADCLSKLSLKILHW